ncbi:MAG: hypothetical protein R2746_16550 [Acidimicrobiales bacterium]
MLNATGRGRRAPGGQAEAPGKQPEVAAVANGGGPIAGAVILTREA